MEVWDQAFVGFCMASQAEVDIKSPTAVDIKSPTSVVQEYDRKKKLAGDLGNGFVRFKLSPSKVNQISLPFTVYSTKSEGRKRGFGGDSGNM